MLYLSLIFNRVHALKESADSIVTTIATVFCSFKYALCISIEDSIMILVNLDIVHSINPKEPDFSQT